MSFRNLASNLERIFLPQTYFYRHAVTSNSTGLYDTFKYTPLESVFSISLGTFFSSMQAVSIVNAVMHPYDTNVLAISAFNLFAAQYFLCRMSFDVANKAQDRSLRYKMMDNRCSAIDSRFSND